MRKKVGRESRERRERGGRKGREKGRGKAECEKRGRLSMLHQVSSNNHVTTAAYNTLQF